MFDNLFAQLHMSISGVYVSYPKVTVGFFPYCLSDSILTKVSKQNLILRENNKEILDYELYDTGWDDYCHSIVFVIAGSKMMNDGFPSGIIQTKALVKSFIDSLPLSCDESELVAYAHNKIFTSPMSSDRNQIKTSIDSVSIEENQAIFDALMIGIDQLVENSTYDCRTIYLISDGFDSSSVHSLHDVIYYALENKGSINVIGLGSQANIGILFQLAADAGGRFYLSPSISEMRWLKMSLCSMIIGDSQYWIEYRTSCDGDSIRKIQLTAHHLGSCNDSITSTRSIRIPVKNIPTTLVDLSLGRDTVQVGSNARIALILGTAIDQEFPEATFRVLFDSSILRFMRIDKKNYLLTQYPIHWKSISGGIEFTIINSRDLNTPGDTLAVLHFDVLKIPTNSETEIVLSDWNFLTGCLSPVLQNGKIIFSPPTHYVGQNESNNKSFYLEQNYPNPFSQTTNVDFRFSNDGNATAIFKVYDIFGREVLDLSDKIDPPSADKLTIDNSQLPIPGIYFYRLTIANESQTKMMTLVK